MKPADSGLHGVRASEYLRGDARARVYSIRAYALSPLSSLSKPGKRFYHGCTRRLFGRLIINLNFSMHAEKIEVPIFRKGGRGFAGRVASAQGKERERVPACTYVCL